MANGTYTVTALTLDDLLRRAVAMVLAEGSGNCAHRGPSREVIGARLELVNPLSRLSRTESRRTPGTAIAELCWYLSGTNAVEPIQFWIGKYADEAEADGTVHGAYGPRLFGSDANDQVHRIVQVLSDESQAGTRRAVIQLFDRTDIAGVGRYRDVPCTSTLQFLWRADGLHMVVNMRSNDVFVGMTHDIFCFTMLQEIVAREIGATMGRYVHVVGSLHLYENKTLDAQVFLDEGWQSTTDPMPTMPAGSQWRQIAALLRAEEHLRAGTTYADLDLPDTAYWADLTRVLALQLARRNGRRSEAERIADDFTHAGFAEFA